MLNIKEIDVSIKSVDILRKVTLGVDREKFVGLIGRNGAGKTTVLKSIIGLFNPAHGSICLENKDITPTPTYLRARQGIGYMPEDRRLVPGLTVEENILLPAWSAGLDNPDKQLRRVLLMIPEIEQFAKRKAMELSGGQQKLVALARSLISGNKLLLLDEPFEGVAPVLAQRLAEVISKLKGEGLSILLTESDLTHSGKLLDTIYTIDRGKVKEMSRS